MQRQKLFYNGTIYSLEHERASYYAMLVGKSGRIEALYPEEKFLPSNILNTELVDLVGKTVVPAFIDTHTHFMTKAALEAVAVNLARLENGHFIVDSLDAVHTLLSDQAAKHNRPIVGFGLCLGAVAERRLPRASELDTWFPGRSVIVLSMDGHSSAYSSIALKKLGIEGIASDGVLSGEAHEFNMGKVSSLIIKSLTPGVLARGISRALEEAVASGLVSIHCLEGTEDAVFDPAVALFKHVGGRLGLRLKLWMQYTNLRRAKRHAGRLSNKRAGGCLAWEMDGSVSSRTAAFDKNYLDQSHAGHAYRSPDEALALVKPFYAHGWQTSAHAIGPLGIESILSAYERLMDEAGDRDNRQRLRIDHFEFPRPDQIARAGAKRLILTVQPGFAWADDKLLHSYQEALASDILASQCPLRQLIDAGCVVTLSTDAPVQPLNPFIQIAGTVNHPVPGARISVYEALRAYSWAGAYAAFEEEERGTLSIGKYADFAILDSNPFTEDREHLHEIHVASTWHEGKRLKAPSLGLAGFLGRPFFTKRRQL